MNTNPSQSPARNQAALDSSRSKVASLAQGLAGKLHSFIDGIPTTAAQRDDLAKIQADVNAIVAESHFDPDAPEPTAAQPEKPATKPVRQ